MTPKPKTLDDIFAEIGFPDPPLLLSRRTRPPPVKRRSNYPTGSCGKVTYPSREITREAIVNRLNKGTGGATHLIPYECHTCKGWHMTSRETDKPYR